MNTISIEKQDAQFRITLERESVHNAFDAQLIHELTNAINEFGKDDQARVLVLTGRGASFSAGADLNWMRSQLSASEAENTEDAKNLAQLMRTLAYCSKPTVARVNGPAYGGGVGLIACCDIAISVETAKFGLTETKLGLVPAVISPYVINAIGARQALRYFQSAEIFDAQRALALGLIHESVPLEQLDNKLTEVLRYLSAAGPIAVKHAKRLVQVVTGHGIEEQMLLDEENAKLIARLRVSPEGQEGISAFLEKRKPNWVLGK